jgi:G:T-mismatch repair DNA endonuclease (very short patch repair protein)
MKNRVCELCGSNKYYCKGMCKNCYNKNHVPLLWADKFEKCVQCSSTKYPHVARGLCRRCYATQPSNVLCACGCGEYVSQVGTKTRKYIHGHRINIQWKDPKYRKWHISLFQGDKNPMWGKFGKDHPSYKHKKTDQYRKDASQRMLERMTKGERKVTNIEIILSKILDDMKIKHYPQFLMYNKFVVDEYLPDFNLVIEAYGGYWHGDARRFPNPDKMQTKNQKRDSSRIKYLEKCGVKTIILWENELTKDIEWCKSQIRMFTN